MALLAKRLLSVFGPPLLVIGAVATGLVVLDGAARAFATPPRERNFPTVPELERAIGHRVTIPTYFPSSVVWPPSSIEVVGPAVVLGFSSSDGRPRLQYAQSISADEPLPDDLVSPGLLVEHVATRVGPEAGVLSRIRAEDGVLWNQLQWRRSGRTFLMRSSGTLEELMKMAASVHPGAW